MPVRQYSSIILLAVYPSYFKSQGCWPPLLTQITYQCMLIEVRSVAAYLRLELFWVYMLVKPRYR
ncbi:hypothetical protein BSR00_10555 [Serratia liquefaciens]|nr:hypothetical protein BSR00_10555 [Serratia liquefaciens]